MNRRPRRLAAPTRACATAFSRRAGALLPAYPPFCLPAGRRGPRTWRPLVDTYISQPCCAPARAHALWIAPAQSRRPCARRTRPPCSRPRGGKPGRRRTVAPGGVYGPMMPPLPAPPGPCRIARSSLIALPRGPAPPRPPARGPLFACAARYSSHRLCNPAAVTPAPNLPRRAPNRAGL